MLSISFNRFNTEMPMIHIEMATISKPYSTRFRRASSSPFARRLPILRVEFRVDIRGTEKHAGIRNVHLLPRVRGVHAAQNEPARTPGVRLVLRVRPAPAASVAGIWPAAHQASPREVSVRACRYYYYYYYSSVTCDSRKGGHLNLNRGMFFMLPPPIRYNFDTAR